jgi:hypothetical protein
MIRLTAFVFCDLAVSVEKDAITATCIGPHSIPWILVDDRMTEQVLQTLFAFSLLANRLLLEPPSTKSVICGDPISNIYLQLQKRSD